MASTRLGVVLLAGFAGGGAERVATTLLAPPVVAGDAVLITNTPVMQDAYAAPVEVPRIVLGVDVDETSLTRRGPVAAVVGVVRLLRRMRGVLRERQVDAVVSLLTTANLLTILATRGLGIRVIVSERSNPAHQPQPWPVRVARWLTYRFADVVTANSTAAIGAMRGYVPARKLVHVPNAVPLPPAAADVATNRTVLMVGRFHPLKNHAFVIDAFASSGIAGSGWTLAFAGDGARRAELETRAERCGVAASVRMLGFREDLADVYASAGMLVMASDFEGTPNAVLEALAHGVPCVVGDQLDGAVAAMGGGGQTFRGGDVDDLARVLRELADDAAARRALGAAGRLQMADHDPDTVRAQWTALVDVAD